MRTLTRAVKHVLQSPACGCQAVTSVRFIGFSPRQVPSDASFHSVSFSEADHPRVLITGTYAMISAISFCMMFLEHPYVLFLCPCPEYVSSPGLLLCYPSVPPLNIIHLLTLTCVLSLCPTPAYPSPPDPPFYDLPWPPSLHTLLCSLTACPSYVPPLRILLLPSTAIYLLLL